MQKITEKVLTKVRIRLEEEQVGKLRKAVVLGRRRMMDGLPEPVGGDEADLAHVSIAEQLEHLELRRISSSVRAIEAALLTLERGAYAATKRSPPVACGRSRRPSSAADARRQPRSCWPVAGPDRPRQRGILEAGQALWAVERRLRRNEFLIDATDDCPLFPGASQPGRVQSVRPGNI
jgi:hypothetical protein